MTRYCKIQDGVIVKYNVAQKDTGLGAKSPLETYLARGWYPLEDNAPSIDSTTQRISGSSYEVQTDKVVKTYTVVDIPLEEIMEAKAKEAERAVQTHINEVVKDRGYDDENSIAKYLVVGNPFYTECKAISLWIGSVWVYLHTVQADVLAGTIPEPTLEELIAMLPEYI